MKRVFKNLSAAATALYLSTNQAFAALPDVADPTNAAADGNYLELLRGYSFDVGIILGLIISTIGFVVVASQMITTYGAIGRGRATWTDFGMNAGAGVLLLVMVTFLLVEASNVIF